MPSFRAFLPALALLLLAFSAPAQSPQTTVPGRAELSRFIGLYRFGDGSFAEIGWLDDIQGLLLIDYPPGASGRSTRFRRTTSPPDRR